MAVPAAMFEEAVIISGGTFNQFNSPSDSREVLVALSSRINPELFHNSKKHDILRKSSTTFSVTQSEVDDILAWGIGSDVSDGGLQSDLSLRRYDSQELERAQRLSLSLSDELERTGALLASIMLPPHDPVDEYQIIPILVYQMARNLPSFSQHVQDALKNNPILFELNIDSQIEELIIEPLVKSALAMEDISDRQLLRFPNIVVITGSRTQVIQDSAFAHVFDTISTLSKQLGLAVPISLILISFYSKRLSYTLRIVAGAGKLSANSILIIVMFSFSSASDSALTE
ncbi:hypothetical protein BDN70DRAFT_698385 [Pholiota conissans]|uniref:Uncharacterized protein n=1 Tax=Pholiota conissans TaxID=109636 RepID=A0A9P5Z184_9AGAR|nr:hypothetical protein BDN70DRAFT_698385 [Pholiota conissans]